MNPVFTLSYAVCIFANMSEPMIIVAYDETKHRQMILDMPCIDDHYFYSNSKLVGAVSIVESRYKQQRVTDFYLFAIVKCSTGLMNVVCWNRYYSWSAIASKVGFDDVQRKATEVAIATGHRVWISCIEPNATSTVFTHYITSKQGQLFLPTRTSLGLVKRFIHESILSRCVRFAVIWAKDDTPETKEKVLEVNKLTLL